VSHEEELEDSNVETLRRLLRSDALGANSSAELALSMTDCSACCTTIASWPHAAGDRRKVNRTRPPSVVTSRADDVEPEGPQRVLDVGEEIGAIVAAQRRLDEAAAVGGGRGVLVDQLDVGEFPATSTTREARRKNSAREKNRGTHSEIVQTTQHF
jgi:hypothetical protein